jgi:acyl-CoA reductase-like NAD-dependent aldehyde dehydrogenase
MTLDREFTMTIRGEPARGELEALRVVNPATEQVIATAPSASRDQLDLAVQGARDAQPAWAATPVAERKDVVRELAGRITEHADELATLLTQEQGKPRANARIEVERSAQWIRSLAELELDDVVVVDDADRRVTVRRVPLGVVGAIVPWNFPVSLALWKVGPALLTGNTIVLKPSPNTPLTGLALGELARDIVPAGVLSVITGGDELGPWMTAHHAIDKIAFTGSTETGKRVMASAAAHLARVTLELGGNDPAIVMPDVDVAATAEKLFWACFNNTSQYCLATKRLYVHDEIFDEFAHHLARVAADVRIGNGMDEGTQLGPLQNRRQYEVVQDFIAESRQRGDEFLVEVPVDHDAGYFVGPIVVGRPPEDSRLVTEEPFGPIVPMLSFTDVDDVVARANDSRYGLGASVWSGDDARAEEIARRIDSGVVWVNEVQVLSPFFPMGGHRQSGIGRENGVDGLLEYTNTQSLSVRRGRASAPPSMPVRAAVR